MGWKNYKHRLIPWLALNWSTRLVKQVEAGYSLERGANMAEQLSLICKSLEECFPTAFTPRDWKRMAAVPEEVVSHSTEAKHKILREFRIAHSLRPSEVGGVGVFTDTDIGAGKLVALYPGTVYLPFEPLFFQSLRNQFLFRCSSGHVIDGKCTGLSKYIFLSCAYRDLVGGALSCDPSWLEKSISLNPLSIGQFINNHTRSVEANVEYVEMEIPPEFPHTWRRFLPNIFYSASHSPEISSRSLVIVGLCTTRPVMAGEELFSSYLTVVTSSTEPT